MNGETQFLSKSQFAALQGWSPSYVTKLGQQDRLVFDETKKLIDVSKTLAGLQRTSDPAKAGVRDHHQANRVERDVGIYVKPTAPAATDPAIESTAPSTDPKYWDKKTRREGALAELAELELSKKRGELVDRARVEQMSFAVGRTLRDAVLGLPTRLAPVFATMTDSFEIEVKLREALRQAFEDAAKMTAEDYSRLAEPSH